MKIALSLIFITFIISASADSLEVLTSSGTTEGYIKKGAIHWDDIPYAKPPIGNLRWKAPRKIEQNSNLILPKDGNFCIQRTSVLGGSSQFSDDLISGSEDCLYLDIYAPKKKSEGLLPVMFWIHGGGNTSGLKDLYNFSKFVKKHNVIVITINYRLGPLGWFTHPSIQSFQDGLDKTSNFGTLDIITALEWVNNNISLFGGNANNITIFGESAGGHNVLSLLASPLSDGLFHKAISQSGYTTTYTKEEAYGSDQQDVYNNKFAADKVLSTNDLSGYGSIKNLFLSDKQKYGEDYQRYLRSIDGKALLETYKQISKDTYDRLPILTRDGIVVHTDGVSAGLAAAKNKNNIPVIAGSNQDELSLWLASNRYFVNASYPFTKLVPLPKIEFKREDLYKLWVKTRSQGWKLRGVDEPLMELEKSGNNSLYAYRFDWDDQAKSYFADFSNLIGSAHGIEISFVTGDFKFGPIVSGRTP